MTENRPNIVGKKKKGPTSINLDPAIKKELEHACTDLDLTQAQAIRSAIRLWLDQSASVISEPYKTEPRNYANEPNLSASVGDTKGNSGTTTRSGEISGRAEQLFDGIRQIIQGQPLFLDIILDSLSSTVEVLIRMGKQGEPIDYQGLEETRELIERIKKRA